MKSLESNRYVRITFSWQYNYCYLTAEAIEYLREYLTLPPKIVPATHEKSATWPESRDREELDHPPAFDGDRGGAFGRGGKLYKERTRVRATRKITHLGGDTTLAVSCSTCMDARA